MNGHKNKNVVLITVLLLFFLVIILNFTSSELIPIRDVEIKIILEEPEPNITYTEIFRVENLDHVTGTTDLLHFFISASLKNNSTNTTWNTTRSINKFTQTGMGEISLQTGRYELCVNLIPLNFHDYNLSNNEDCKIIMTSDYEPGNETNTEEPEEENEEEAEEIEEEEEEAEEISLCDCELQIITEKQLYNEGESISFIIRDCWETTTFKEEVEYWAEDLFGEITKTKLSTTSKAPKSYTPRLQEQEKTFLLKAKIKQCNKTTSRIITLKGAEPEKKDTHIEIKTQNQAVPEEIIIIELQGYKAQTLKTLIDIQLELNNKRKSQTLKAYIPQRNQEFNLRIPFQIPTDLPEGEKEYALVARGLDQEEKTKITINVPIKEPIPEPILITNLYTRKQKFDGELNIITTWQGTNEATLRFTTQKETKEITTEQKTITTPLIIKKHNETIIAEIIKNNETQHIQILKLDLETDEEEPEQTTQTINKNETNNKTSQEITMTTQKNEEEPEPEVKPEINQEPAKEQEKTKTAPTAKTASFIAENKKQTIFIALATMSLIFLFRKEILTQTKKIKTLL